MRNLSLLIAAYLLSASCLGAEVTQPAEDRCSLAIPIKGNTAIVCNGVDPKALARLDELLNKKDLELNEKVEGAEAWARSYRELEEQLQLEERDIPLAGTARELLKEGKLEDAGAILDQLIGSDQIDTDRIAAHHYERAQIFALQFDALRALPHYASAYHDRPNTLRYAFGYAKALHRERRHEEALPLYEHALRLARAQAKLDATAALPVATILSNLGNVYAATQRWNAAEETFQEALGLYRHLAETNPAARLPDVAITLVSLGNLYGDTQRLPEAANAFREALDIRRQLARANPARYLPDVATTLNNLGILYRNADQLQEAQDAYREALEIRRRLAKTDPASYLPYVAATLNNLGVLYRNTQRSQEAEDAYREALADYRQLAGIKPTAYLPDVAMTLNNLGVLYRNTQRLKEAEDAFREALAIRRELAGTNPATYLPFVGNSLNNLGALYRDTQRLQEAEDTLLEAQEIRAQLAAQNPSVYTRNLVQTLRNLQELYDQMGRTEDAQRVSDQLEEVGSPSSVPRSR